MKTFVGTAARLTALSIIVAAFIAISGISIVATKGISMQPAFYDGDLAILHRTTQYAVGDVAVYSSGNMDTAVMHRIVASDNGRYTFQGDNNTWLDPEQPSRDQLGGKLALRIPHGGTWLARATNPAALGGIAFIVLVSGGTAVTLTRRGRRTNRHIARQPPAARTARLRALPPSLRNAVGGVALFGLASLVMTVVSWSLPTGSAAALSSPANATFSYRTVVQQSPAYDRVTVTDPQPVFRALTDVVDIAFVYDGGPGEGGTIGVAVELATANGWQSRVPMTATHSFSRTPYRGTVRLNLPDLQQRAEAAAAVIGAGAAGEVSVTVVASITAGNGAAFRPVLAFTLDNAALRLAQGAATNLRTDAPGPDGTASGLQSGAISILGRSLPINYARTAALGGVAAALIAAGIVALLARRAATASEANALTARYPGLLVPVEPLTLPPQRPVIDLPRTDALIRVAQQYGLMVMHWDHGGTHTYVVLDDHATYRCSTGPFDAHSGPPAATATHLVPAAPLFDTVPLHGRSGGGQLQMVRE